MEACAWHREALKETEALVRSGKAKFMDWGKSKALLLRFDSTKKSS